mgnify:CR=1 FL=1
MCPICDKDIRFFCDCRVHDKDYERPLPQGWKDSKLGFEDNYDKYSMAEPDKIAPSPPPQPFRPVRQARLARARARRWAGRAVLFGFMSVPSGLGIRRPCRSPGARRTLNLPTRL